MSVVENIENGYLREDVPEFNIGDTIRVSVKVKEGEKERTQIYEGVVIGGKGSGTRETFKLRDGGTEWMGKVVHKAVSNVNDIIAPILIAQGTKDQKEIDYKMIELDGTPNKRNYT